MKNNTQKSPSYLLIDDDTNFGKIVQKYAKTVGVNVTCVKSIKNLKNLDSIRAFDAVLLDYDLEDMTGFEVAEYLDVHLKNKPVVMVSSTNRPYQDRLANLSNIAGWSCFRLRYGAS